MNADIKCFESKVLTIRCFEECTYHIEYPEFFLMSDLKTSQKILGYLYQFSWKNDEETFAYLDEHMPSLLEEGLKRQPDLLGRIFAEREMALTRCVKPEDRDAVRNAYAAKLRKMKKMPETVQKLVKWWGENYREGGAE